MFNAENIGRNGFPILCILGRPYKIPGEQPLEYKFLYVSSDIMDYFYIILRKRLILSSQLYIFLKTDSERILNLLLSSNTLFIFSIYSDLFMITTPFPLSGSQTTMDLSLEKSWRSFISFFANMGDYILDSLKIYVLYCAESASLH